MSGSIRLVEMVDISKFIARAEDAFKKRNYEYAIQMYLEALQIAPENLDARKRLRVVLLQAEKDSVKIPPIPGRTLVLSRDPKVQIAEHEKAVVKDPRSAKYNMRVADTLAQMGHHEAAGHIYQYIIDFCDKGKDNLEAMKKGAKAFIDAQMADLAQKLLTRARALAPQDKEITDLARNTAAASTLSRISAAKSSREMLANTGEAMELELLNRKVLTKEELPKAIEVVDRKIGEHPTDKTWIKKKAELFGKARQYDQAFQWLMAKYEELDKPQDLVELATRYKNQDFEFKLRYCAKKIQDEPQAAAEWKAKAARVKAEQSKFQIAEYMRQVEEAPADMDKRFQLGKALFEAKQFAQAVEHIQKASKSPKLGKQVGVLLGRCFAQMNRLELAEKQLQNVRAQITEAEEDLFNDVRYWLGDVYARQGKTDEAVQLFQGLFLDNAAFRDVGQRLDALQGRK
ncbi:MAG: tetratricopeptide repeat protein [Planctomycetes bacterium]|nr:tetratricopeptide repeat protein [Planctomycetota bacterium]NUQ33764.1 tetratricopeptide repeat protein [Planctomycetaceae bacterium]